MKWNRKKSICTLVIVVRRKSAVESVRLKVKGGGAGRLSIIEENAFEK